MRGFLQSGLGIGLVVGVLLILLSFTPLASLITLPLLLAATGIAGHLAGNRSLGMMRAAREGSLAGAISSALMEVWGWASGAQTAYLRQVHAPPSVSSPIAVAQGDLEGVLIFVVVGAALGALGGFVGRYAARQRGR